MLNKRWKIELGRIKRYPIQLTSHSAVYFDVNSSFLLLHFKETENKDRGKYIYRPIYISMLQLCARARVFVIPSNYFMIDLEERRD